MLGGAITGASTYLVAVRQSNADRATSELNFFQAQALSADVRAQVTAQTLIDDAILYCAERSNSPALFANDARYTKALLDFEEAPLRVEMIGSRTAFADLSRANTDLGLYTSTCRSADHKLHRSYRIAAQHAEAYFVLAARADGRR